MRQRIVAVIALLAIMSLPILVKGQDTDARDKTWPSLASADKDNFDAPRFIIESEKLERAPNESNPLPGARCLGSSKPCRMRVTDFYSEVKWPNGILRPEVMRHHYPHVMFDSHFYPSGTDVFFLPKHDIFFLWGDCGMDHRDEVAGPFAGDPRLVLKKLAADPDSLALLGVAHLLVPFQTVEEGLVSSDKAWPAVRELDIDISKLEPAKGVLNPLSIDRCAASSAECVLNLEDFSTVQTNRSGKPRRVLRPGVIAQYYYGQAHQYVFYLLKQNIFYVARYGPSAITVSGPFAGDPRVVLKKIDRGR